MQPNEIYNTHLRLIFYDEPVFGHYQKRFDRIFAEPRYTDLAANLAYFSQLYTAILARPRTPRNETRRAPRSISATMTSIAEEKAKRGRTMLAKLSGAAG